MTPPRSSIPYTTHVPVLIGLSRLYEIKKVIEYGSGFYSTPLFLDRRVFPDLEHLTSCENSEQWTVDVIARTGESSAGRHIWHSGSFENPVDQSFDLAFVDSDTELNKIKDIELCSKRNGFTVIHDFEWPPYRAEVERTFQHYMEFPFFNPTTAVCWRGFCPVPVEGLLAVKDIICNYSNLSPVDIEGWLRVFEKHKELYESAWS